jgi:hypothetical protein
MGGRVILLTSDMVVVWQNPIQYIAVHLRAFWGSVMATTKTATLTIRVDPDLKEALRIAAEAEYRSIANMIEVLIRNHCEKNDIAVKKSKGTDLRRERSV